MVCSGEALGKRDAKERGFGRLGAFVRARGADPQRNVQFIRRARNAAFDVVAAVGKQRIGENMVTLVGVSMIGLARKRVGVCAFSHVGIRRAAQQVEVQDVPFDLVAVFTVV